MRLAPLLVAVWLAPLCIAQEADDAEGWGVFDSVTGMPYTKPAREKASHPYCGQLRGRTMRASVQGHCFKGCEVAQGTNAFNQRMVAFTGAACGFVEEPPAPVKVAQISADHKREEPPLPFAWMRREACPAYKGLAYLTSERGQCLGACGVDVSAEGKFFRLALNGKQCPSYGKVVHPSDAMRVDIWARAKPEPTKPIAAPSKLPAPGEKKENAKPSNTAGPVSVFFRGGN